jgi:hypothetical protein
VPELGTERVLGGVVGRWGGGKGKRVRVSGRGERVRGAERQEEEKTRAPVLGSINAPGNGSMARLTAPFVRAPRVQPGRRALGIRGNCACPLAGGRSWTESRNLLVGQRTRVAAAPRHLKGATASDGEPGGGALAGERMIGPEERISTVEGCVGAAAVAARCSLLLTLSLTRTQTQAHSELGERKLANGASATERHFAFLPPPGFLFPRVRPPAFAHPSTPAPTQAASFSPAKVCSLAFRPCRRRGEPDGSSACAPASPLPPPPTSPSARYRNPLAQPAATATTTTTAVRRRRSQGSPAAPANRKETEGGG